jgi:hypothetical protein
MKPSFSAGLVVAGLLLSACANGSPTASQPQRAPKPSDAPTKPTAATTTASPTGPATTAGSTSATPSDDASAPASSAPVSSSAAPGADAAPTAEQWADDLFAGKSAQACALMDGTATAQLIGYAQQADPSVRNCGDAALALFQQADMQGTAYAKATAKPAQHDATSITYTLTYTEGHKPEKVTLTQADAGWLVDDYQPAS